MSRTTVTVHKRAHTPPDAPPRPRPRPPPITNRALCPPITASTRHRLPGAVFPASEQTPTSRERLHSASQAPPPPTPPPPSRTPALRPSSTPKAPAAARSSHRLSCHTRLQPGASPLGRSPPPTPPAPHPHPTPQVASEVPPNRSTSGSGTPRSPRPDDRPPSTRSPCPPDTRSSDPPHPCTPPWLRAPPHHPPPAPPRPPAHPPPPATHPPPARHDATILPTPRVTPQTHIPTPSASAPPCRHPPEPTRAAHPRAPPHRPAPTPPLPTPLPCPTSHAPRRRTPFPH
ncbi:unnamed protein product [Dicrocoelium dendriticum]|nr:unnamed protein product [Dicrocoelium dendriticum]